VDAALASVIIMNNDQQYTTQSINKRVRADSIHNAFHCVRDTVNRVSPVILDPVRIYSYHNAFHYVRDTVSRVSPVILDPSLLLISLATIFSGNKSAIQSL